MDHASRLPRTRRWLALAAAAVACAVALAAGAAYWLVATESGARFVLARVAGAAGIQFGAIRGALVGPLAIDALEYGTPGLRVRASRVDLDWSPARLASGELRIVRLHAAALDVATAPSPEPAREPATLALPLRVTVDRASADRLGIGRIGGEDGTQELREVVLQFAADGDAWKIGAAQATTPYGRAKLAGRIAAHKPYALEAQGELAGTRGQDAYRAAVAARGTLARIDLALEGREGGLTGRAQATVEPFAQVPLRALQANLDGLDLAAFAAAPRTRLAVAAELAPREGILLAGPVRIANADAGPLDRERLPIVSAAAQVAITADRVQATQVAIAFAGGGGARGEAAWSGGQLEARFDVRDADLLAWHSQLRATKLGGTIAANAGAQVQAATVNLADPRFAIEGALRLEGRRLTVERARLARGPAIAEAAGTLALDGGRNFDVQGRVERLDPAAFAKVPPGELNATFAASGTLSPRPAGELRLDLAQSRYAGMDAKGRLALATDGEILTRSQADLALGATRLVATGALGRPGDTLDLKLSSPDLAPLGRAFGIVLGGRVDLAAQVSGTLAAAAGQASLDAKDLVLPGAIRIASVRSRLELGTGDAGVANGELALAGLVRGEGPEALLERAELKVKGTRAAHEIRLEARRSESLVVRALLDGGVVPGARLPEWRGRLESLDIGGVANLALAAPASLVAGAERVELGEATLAGEPGSIRLAATRWTPAEFAARGSSSAVVIRVVRQMLGLQGEAVASNLVLAGEWDVRVGESVDGHVVLRRERGDVRLGEPRQALGLETLELRAQASGGQVRAVFDLRGKQVGTWQGEASATLARDESGWAISPVAPIAGRFTVDVPDLAWMAAWLGPEAHAGGRLRGEGTLAGSLRDPAWRGRIEATGLALREPALGAEVTEGTVAIALDQREARIERFVLAAPWRPTDAAAKAIAAAKRPALGTVTAEGSVDLGTRKGTVHVRAAAFPLTRLATRFLAVSGEGRAEFDAGRTALTGDFRADAGWFGIPAAAPPALSDDVIVVRGEAGPAAAPEAGRLRLDLRVDLGEHLHFEGRGLATRLAGSLRLAGEPGANLRTTGTIRAVGGTYDAYGRTLAIERGALNFQGAVDNPGLNVLALRKGQPVEAGVEIVGTVARPRVRLVSSPDVPDSEKLAWLVLGRGKSDVTAADAATLVSAASALLGREAMPAAKLFQGLGLDEVSVGAGDAGVLGAMPQSTVAGRTNATSAAEVVTVGKQLTDNLRVSYKQGLADAEGSFRIALRLTRSLQLIVRAGYEPGVDAAYRFSLK